jgi:polysaccharide biosynthesis protein PslH
MKVLLVAPQVPWPLHQGTAIRNFHVARHLAARHAVTVLAFGAPDAPRGPLDAAGVRTVAVPAPPPRPAARRFVDLFATATPDLARRLDDPAMAAACAEVMAGAPGGRFDVVQVEGLEMACHGMTAWLAHGLPRPRLVYDAHNAEWVLQDRAWRTDLAHPRLWHGALYSLAQTWKLRRFERWLLGTADATVAVSARDAEALHAVAPGAPITVVPNGVDTEHYRPADRAATEAELAVFTGKMDFRPNVDAMTWFVRDVWPRVREERPSARLAIVGRDPVPRVRALAGAGVEVTGAVDDVRPYLARAGVVVVPLRVGGGTRLKVLEAMAMAKAIAATPMAVEGLHVNDGAEALLDASAAGLVEAVLRLMGDPGLRAALGGRARARAEAEYGWAALVPAIEALYGRVAT